MSGTSRIGGSGGYAGTGGRQSRSPSLVRFCRGRKQGDVVSGEFLRLENDSFGWALLEGEELLAHLPEDWGEGGNQPSPGDRVFFRIESLVPDVVLRLLPAADPLARISSILPSLPMAQEAGLYASARDRFDTLLAACRDEEPGLFSEPDPVARKAAFIERVAGDPALLGAFAATRARSRALCRAAASSGLLFFQHMPWLCGGLDRIEVSLWRDGESPVLAGARLPSGDGLLLHGAMENGVLRYRLRIAGMKGDGQRPPMALPRTAAADCLGYAVHGRPDSPGRAVDLVGRILALAADSGIMAVGRYSRKL
ncbi:MAG: hypothetical protein LIP28_07075 [Deltaproteobacteria bacterium]|nr:hypothetical protein [Deltaproteobacteria bacterium]